MSSVHDVTDLMRHVQQIAKVPWPRSCTSSNPQSYYETRKLTGLTGEASKRKSDLLYASTPLLQRRLRGSDPWSRIPLYMLDQAPASRLQVRHSSSDARSDLNDTPQLAESTAQSPGERTPKSSFASALSFQSLSGLFAQPAPRRYSRPEPKPSDDGGSTPRTPSSTAKQSDREVKEQVGTDFFQPSTAPMTEAERTGENESSSTDKDIATASVPTTTAPSNAKPKANSAPKVLHKHSSCRVERMTGNATYSIGQPAQHKAPTARRVPSTAPEFKRLQSRQQPEPKKPWGLSSDDMDTVDSIADPNSALHEGIEGSSNMRAPDSSTPAGLRRDTPERGEPKLTHVTSSGEAHMVDVGAKPSSRRVAVAFACVTFSNPEPFRLIFENNNKKGDVLGVARVAGIMAAKRTSDLIPLCHPIAISKVEVDTKLEPPGAVVIFAGPNINGTVTVRALVECTGPTGVEMEALTAVTGAALTVYDMCKAVDRDMKIRHASVVYKSGGRSGLHVHSAWAGETGRDFFEAHKLELPEGTQVKRKQTGRGQP